MTIKEKPAFKLRHEWKYPIPPQEAMVLSSRLGKLFRRDVNADSHGFYRVSSLYFDTPCDKALRQKLDGVDQREKFRLRYYGTDLSFLRLEKKSKQGGLCAKQSVGMTCEQAQRLLRGDIDFLLKGEHPLFAELYSKMKGQLLAPKTVVTYDREAFLYAPGNVRITIDRDLRTGLGNLHFLDPHRFHAPVSDGMAVLEVKYDAFLPQLAAMAVQLPNRQASAYSKYAVCRRYD